jgi:uncharacterized membrane protein YidH (DUF202 family)
MIGREEFEENLMRKNPRALSVLLSKERTLLSRERTSISLAQLALGIAAFGFLVIRFFTDPGYEWFLAIGVGFVIVSAWLFYHAFREYRHFGKKLAKLHEKRGHLDTVYISDLEV